MECERPIADGDARTEWPVQGNRDIQHGIARRASHGERAVLEKGPPRLAGRRILGLSILSAEAVSALGLARTQDFYRPVIQGASLEIAEASRTFILSTRYRVHHAPHGLLKPPVGLASARERQDRGKPQLLDRGRSQRRLCDPKSAWCRVVPARSDRPSGRGAPHCPPCRGAARLRPRAPSSPSPHPQA